MEFLQNSYSFFDKKYVESEKPSITFPSKKMKNVVLEGFELKISFSERTSKIYVILHMVFDIYFVKIKTRGLAQIFVASQKS